MDAPYPTATPYGAGPAGAVVQLSFIEGEVIMKNKLSAHHSVSDWDFQAGMHHTLTELQFVSAPSSLECWWQEGNPLDSSILCRIAETQVIAEGEVRTWYRTTNFTRPVFLLFRNQHALGGADRADCYHWDITSAWAYLSRRIADVPVEIGHFSILMYNNTWHHLRTRFWSGKNPAGEDALNVELFLEVDGDWVQQGTTLYDTENQWKDSEINRLGIGGRTDSAPHHFFDDTEIWAPV